MIINTVRRKAEEAEELKKEIVEEDVSQRYMFLTYDDTTAFMGGNITTNTVLQGEVGYGALGRVVGGLERMNGNLTPGTKDVVYPSVYTNAGFVIKGDANLVSSVIRSGVSIFGVEGAYSGGTSADVFADMVIADGGDADRDALNTTYNTLPDKVINNAVGVVLAGAKKEGAIPAMNPTTGELLAWYDFTRATSGTYVDASGILQTAGANVPRIDYTTTPCILLEAARTNYNPYSSDFTQWTAISSANVTTVTQSSKNYLGQPYYEISKLAGAAAESGRRIPSQTLDIATTATLIVRATIRQGSIVPGRASLRFFANGVFKLPASVNVIKGAVTYSLYTSVNCSAIADENCVIEMVYNDVDLTLPLYYMLFPYAGDTAANAFLISSLQIEIGSTATSLIPTSGAIATRGADGLQVPVNSLQSVAYMAADGTIKVFTPTDVTMSGDTMNVAEYIAANDGAAQWIAFFNETVTASELV